MSGTQSEIEIQPRDIALLLDLFVSRVMTLAHIAELHFEGREEAAKKRVQKLKAAGFITERPRKARDPSVLILAPAGHAMLMERGHLADFPRLSSQAFAKRSRVSDLTIRHELAVMDVKAALAPAIHQMPGFKVIEFSTWPLLCEFQAQPDHYTTVRVRPDGFIRVEETTLVSEVYEHAFYLEVDRGTETLDTLAKKALCYRHHYASGGYAVSRGGLRGQFSEYPFRVLIVLPGNERRNNLIERLLSLQPPIETQVWATTANDLSADPLGAIWIRPRDHRTSATPEPHAILTA
jgi:hypothetical protein